uniref:biotin synthase n=1 Tax=Methanothermobacter thermautotrophicus TaxID=145262 RepID=Q50525_METTF|nr:unknown [Methanothermobacter thermautotrophicus]
MINRILKRAESGNPLSDEELLELFRINRPEEFADLMDTAFNIMRDHRDRVKLTSTVHITNICQVTPRCRYCGFAAGTSKNGYYTPFFKTDDEILEAVRIIEESGIPRVSCSGAHGFNGEHAVKAAEIVKENTSLELLINVGADLTLSSTRKLADYGTDTVCCNLETINNDLFNLIKPGERLEDRIRVCESVCDSGIELSSGLLIGLGESYADRIRHLRFLDEFESLGEIPIMGFNPYSGTPMENHPPCPLDEQMKTIAITRILYPDIRITVATPTIGPENARFSLMAGADNLATVIPDGYPHDVKGVGSPRYGNLNDVLMVIQEMGLKPQLNFAPEAEGVAIL